MLDIVAVKSPPRAGDTPSQTEQRPVNNRSKNPSEQEFQSAYESTSDDTRPKSDQEKAQENSSAQNTDSERERTSADGATAEDAELSEVAAVEGQAKLQDTKEKPNGDSVSGVRPDGQAARHSGEKLATVAGEKQPALMSSTANATSETGATDSAVVKKETAGKTPAEAIIMSKAVEAGKKGGTDVPVEMRAGGGRAEMAKQSAGNQPLAAMPKTNSKSIARSKDEPLPRDAEFSAAQTNPARKSVSLVPAQNAAMMTKAPLMATTDGLKDKLDLSPVAASDGDSFGSWETRSTTQASNTSLAQILSRPETPSMIARQMAEALQKLPDRPVEISLNPKELGRVRMNISAAEAGITVNIVAERPETLDLMRRNIEQLAREFQLIGYEDIAFAFSEGEENQAYSEHEGDDEQSDTSRLLMVEEEVQDIARPMTSVSNGIDIRL